MPLKLAFKWISAPYYATDLSVYVFRPYGRHPQVKTLDVILTSIQYEQMRRALVIVNSHNTLAELRRDLFPTRVLQHNVSGLPYTMRLFRIVCAKVTDELVAFMTKACEDINYMVSATICDNKGCAWANLLRFTKDDFVPLRVRYNIFGIWKTATMSPRSAVDKTDVPFRSCSTKLT